MRRIFVPAIAAALLTFCSTDASAFGLLDKICGKNACDAACDIEPACGCEVAMPCAPTCGCEIVEPCCDSGCGHKGGLLAKLFHKNHGCDACAAPTCGCEIAAPTCGCEIAGPCGCDDPCSGPSCGDKVKGFFGKLFHKNHGCDDGCAAPSCGCEVAAPSCGFEPTCGCEPSCGCGF